MFAIKLKIRALPDENAGVISLAFASPVGCENLWLLVGLHRISFKATTNS